MRVTNVPSWGTISTSRSSRRRTSASRIGVRLTPRRGGELVLGELAAGLELRAHDRLAQGGVGLHPRRRRRVLTQQRPVEPVHALHTCIQARRATSDALVTPASARSPRGRRRRSRPAAAPGESRLPIFAPSCPPAAAPTARRTAGGHATLGDEDEEHGGDAVDERGEHVLERVEPLQVLVGDRDPHEREQDDPLRRAEVAAVDAGAEDARPQQRAAVGRARACAARRASARAAAAGRRARARSRSAPGRSPRTRRSGSVEQQDRAGDARRAREAVPSRSDARGAGRRAPSR